jgi:hypothetical protein
LETKALKSGASQFVLHDMKEEFAEQYLFPLLKAGAVYEHKYLLGTSVARPLIAKHLVEVAHETGADAVGKSAGDERWDCGVESDSGGGGLVETGTGCGQVGSGRRVGGNAGRDSHPANSGWHNVHHLL